MKDHKRKEIGWRIQRLIKSRGFRKADIQKVMGVKSWSTIQNWCTGHSIPRGQKLVDLAQLLDTTAHYILTGAGDDAGVETDQKKEEADLRWFIEQLKEQIQLLANENKRLRQRLDYFEESKKVKDPPR
jgi:transcriptional regulator with XRE-family HTH domain